MSNNYSELDLYKLAYELVLEDLKNQCFVQNEVYCDANGNEYNFKCVRFCSSMSDFRDCCDCRESYYLDKARFMLNIK